MKPSPAFQFYPHDFLVGTAELTSEEVGAYIRLLCYQWAKSGLPNDDAKLAQLAMCGGNAVASIRHKFGICEDGMLRNQRLEKVRSEQEEYRKKQSHNAKEGWKHRVGNATAMPTHMPDACSSSSSSSSSITIRKEEPVFKEQLGNLFRRRPTTPWDNREIKVLHKILKRPECVQELAEICNYYQAKSKTPDGKFLRQDLQTLLNNWPGELDRARAYKPQRQTVNLI